MSSPPSAHIARTTLQLLEKMVIPKCSSSRFKAEVSKHKNREHDSELLRVILILILLLQLITVVENLLHIWTLRMRIQSQKLCN